MKKIVLLALIAVTAYSCNKEKSQPIATANPNAMKYSINGIADMDVTKRDSTELDLMLDFLGGNQERVALEISGLPVGVTARFEPQNGIPAFATSLIIVASKNAVAGSYPVKIIAKTPLGGTKEFEFTLHIKPVADCSPFVVGSYSVKSVCNTATTTPSSATIFTIPNKPSQVNISLPTFLGSNLTVKAAVDCEKDSIFIPAQYFMGSLRVIGSGPFTDTSIDITYSLVDTTTGSTFPSDTCGAHFSKF